MAHLIFLIPAFHEGRVIAGVVKGVKSAFSDCEVLVVDDCSADNTGEEAAGAGATVLRHIVNLGQGAALQTGIDYIRRRRFTSREDYVVTFDADGQHSLADVSQAIDAMNAKQADIALGSRFLGTARDMPVSRRIILKLGILYNWLSTGLLLTDAHNGFRVIRGVALRNLHINCNRMAHASEILNEINRLRIPYCEVPCTIAYTEYSLQKGQKARNSLSIIGNHLLYLMFKL